MKPRPALLAILLLAVCGLPLIVSTSYSANPAGATVSEANPKVTWTGALKAATADRCGSANSAACDNFKLTITPPSASYGPYIVEIRLQPAGDWDLEVYDPANRFLKGSGAGPTVQEMVTLYNPPAGTYTVVGSPFAPAVGADGNSYTASAELKHQPPNSLGAPGADNITFTNHTSTNPSASAMGEPSIGVNWKTGKVMFAGGGSLKVFTVTFNDNGGTPAATWMSNSVPIAQSIRAYADPILFTDRQTGRTFAAQEEGLTPFATVQWSDNDGGDGSAANWFPSQGSGVVSGIDHETIGGGPFAPPLTRDPSLPVYPNAVYYCAQELVAANCAVSLDGGVTFGPAVTIYTSECGGLHGHVKVSDKDGTVYVPNRGCGGQQGVAVSEDNGVSWAIRKVPGTSNGDSDPSVGVASDGTIYLGFQDGDGHPKVAVSRDKGQTWEKFGPDNVAFQDVGTAFGIQNTAFPAMVAGDPDRAAFAFLGTPTGGGMQDASFAGVWHLYVAYTFDGGQTWTTVNATPNDPVQRGCIWMQGGTNQCRNLLDFMDAAVDEKGRVVVGYADGCIGNCVNGGANSYTAQGTIARQAAGRRMFAAYDPPVNLVETNTTLTSSPNPSTAGQAVTFTATVISGSGTPAGSVTFKEGGTTLGTGGLNAAGQATFATSALPAGSHSITAAYSGDATHAPSASAALVQTVNSLVDPGCNVPGVTVVRDSGTNDATDGQAAHDIISASVAYPYTGDAVPDRLVFTIKVASLSTLVPGTSYFTSFTIDGRPEAAGNVYGVRMDVGPTGTPTFASYVAGASNAGTVDGRFVSSSTPAEAGSTYNPNGTITIIVKPGNVGVTAPSSGKRLTLFNGGVSQTAGGVVTAVVDWMPVGGDGFVDTTTPARDDSSSFTVQSNQTCKPNEGTPTATTLTSAPNPSITGQAVTFTATVISGSGTPAGSVAFNEGGTLLGLGSLDAAGQATLTTSALTAGTHPITAVYSGGGGYASSTSAVLTQVVGDAPVGPPPAAGFSHNTITDFSAVSGEPIIRVDKKDNVFVSSPFGLSTTVSLLWKSSDRGRTFIPLGSPIVRDAVTGPGGGDTHMDFDAMNRLYYADLSGGCVMVAVSEDEGNTFPVNRTSHLTCIGEAEDLEGLQDDRQWVAGFGDGIGYMTVRNLAVALGEGNFHLAKTTDGGQTWHTQILGDVDQSGPLQVDKQKRRVVVNGAEKDAILLYQLYYTGGTLKVLRVADFNDGSPYKVDDLTIGTPGGTVANVFPVLSVDRAGNLYVVWSGSASAIYLATSTDRGEHWSAPIRVSPTSMTGTNIMPWVVAGDPGRVDVIWYRTPGGNNASSVWDIHMAQSIDALSASPSFTVNKVNETVIHRGEICLRGLNCDLPTSPGDRSFLEFPSVDIDSRGAAYITYNDNTNQVQGTYVMVARQNTGASLYAAAGRVDDPDPSQVAITSPSAGQTFTEPSVNVTGTHQLPLANEDNDEAGDAKFPDHGAVVGSNIPAMDIRQVSVSDDPNYVTVTMKMADLTLPSLVAAPALSGGDGVLYLTQWDYNDKVYWVGAEVRAGQPVFLTGTLGIIKSATSKKYITFNPDLTLSQQVQGQINSGAPGTITMRVPRSIIGAPANNGSLFGVTGYALSERGPLVPVGTDQQPNPTSLPVQVDAAGAFTHVVGSGARLDGVVEVSLDDTSFANPRAAALTSGNGWQLSLGPADLTPGAHTLYARQRAFGRAPSAAASVPFSFSPGADVAVAMTADRDPAPVGLNFNYNIAVSNAGPLAATNVVITDVLPSQVTLTATTASQGSCAFASATRTVTCQLGTLANGGAATVRLTVKPREEGTLNNTATATLAETDLNPANNSASVNGLQALKITDVSVTMTDSPDPVLTGQQTTYTMVVRNSGSTIAATGVVLTDALPPSMTFVSATTTQGTLVTPPVDSSGIVTANIGALNVNATATVTVTVKATQNGAITNTATANGNETDPNTANNTASQTTTVNATVALQKVLLAKQTLTGGCENTTGQVYLVAPAPAGGMLVNLSSNVSGASVPQSIVIPAGQAISAPFTVTTSPVTAKQTGLIIATNGTSTVSRGITINVGSGTCP